LCGYSDNQLKDLSERGLIVETHPG
jgi:hypothetical protein